MNAEELLERKKINELLYKHNLEILEKNKALSILSKNIQESNENLEKLVNQRENFMHLLAHKIKGSLNHAKIIFSEILENTFGDISSDLKEVAQKGLDSIKLSIRTIDLILNTANMQKGIIQFSFQVLDFKDLILKVFDIKKVAAEAKNLKFEILIPKDEEQDFRVIGDEFWLIEAVQNLVDNAIKYTPSGSVTLGIKKENNIVKAFVKDTGVGISEEDKKKLFTEGGMGKNSLKINTESTGFGLYSVKLIIDGHHGRVWMESEEGKGSTFWIELDGTLNKFI